MLQIYNSLTHQKETFKPLVEGKVGLYVCGVTIYDLCHIGHARTYVAFDVAVRYLRYSGYDVTYVRNVTDVDDKIIKRAEETNQSIDFVTEQNLKLMHEDFAALNLVEPDIEPRVTTHMAEIIALIEQLLEKKHAYVSASGDVLFDVSSFPDYGKLSGQAIEQLQSGARVAVAEGKEDPLDFVLWKKAKAGEPSWSSPWGEGRPGWHIECSAMNGKHLGKHFDIHGGGSDLQFPHHENEIAQSCCANDSPYVNYWMHTGMVQVDSEKMSKSLGNFFTIRDVLKTFDAETVRFFLLSGHYRSQLNYSQSHLEQARSALERLYTALRGVTAVAATESFAAVYREKFKVALDDDFNVPEAMTVIFDLARELNRLKGQENQQQEMGMCVSLMKEFGAVLGILEQDPEQFLRGQADTDEVSKIEALIQERNDARAAKDWARADKARDALQAMNIVLEDGPEGTRWRKG
ncbi:MULTISPECIES: cysteine--tRNA ligase [Gammaproteobacteria]|uniref:cysteine--tRNA ligase n=1 Tax=Gammaproteobacteria TaxID=1236 RepID=UPI000DCFA49A|nr:MULTISPECIES: cysteine--tRNA ligase [Gammaproteobacteria]RTE86850.1 cysteine--tRNA ligase [Aliidiomarina sp. B3213]TCZ93361.1 cysteine--tRNA ligase [Lysobacter sp. N42]